MNVLLVKIQSFRCFTPNKAYLSNSFSHFTFSHYTDDLVDKMLFNRCFGSINLILTDCKNVIINRLFGTMYVLLLYFPLVHPIIHKVFNSSFLFLLDSKPTVYEEFIIGCKAISETKLLAFTMLNLCD